MNIETPVGTIRTVAGNGEPALSGDGEAAVDACLNEPKGLTFDGEGNLLIADSENHVVRKVDRMNGTIMTVAGCSGAPNPRLEMVKSDAGATSREDPFSE
ncbi:MAG TPA: hypothetical protein VGR71_17900, partial [Nitrospira sp.]|nr:hypothetical protein [Nitrospira sp.]